MPQERVPSSKESEKLLREIRDLMVLQLRHNKVPASAIGKILGISAKSVQNRYSIGRNKGEETEENEVSTETLNESSNESS